MWQDPVVNEVRIAAESIEQKYGGNIHKYFNALKQHQKDKQKVLAPQAIKQ